MQKFYATLVSFASATQHRIREEKGATAVEYGLLVGLIAVAIIVTVTTLGGQLDALFAKVSAKLTGPAGS
jgi:pilus assembly protein Flp/PilA